MHTQNSQSVLGGFAGTKERLHVQRASQPRPPSHSSPSSSTPLPQPLHSRVAAFSACPTRQRHVTLWQNGVLSHSSSGTTCPSPHTGSHPPSPAAVAGA